MIILTHSSNDPSYELGLNKLELYSVLGVNREFPGVNSFLKMSWEDKFNTYFHKITAKTTTGLISDEKGNDSIVKGSFITVRIPTVDRASGDLPRLLWGFWGLAEASL